MYSISQFGGMIADPVRMDAYNLAMQRAVSPGSVVLDIGAGTGIFSLLACRHGAARVYSVELADAILTVKESAGMNGYADRIHVLQGISTALNLPEKVDVVVSDLRGVIPLFQQNLPSVIDARKRFLREGGRLISQRDSISMAPVEAGEPYTHKVSGHHPNSLGINMEPALRYACNAQRRVSLKRDALLSEPLHWATIDYTKIETSDFAGTLTWTVARNGTCQGVAAWFETELLDGIGFSTAPGLPETVYGQMFFPWLRSVRVQAGDQIKVKLQANLLKDDYVWRWDSQVFPANSPDKPCADFRQSDFQATVRLTSALRKRANSYVPSLNPDAQIERQILNWMDGSATVQEIARRTQEAYPDQFKNGQEAFDRVSAISAAHSD